MYLKLPVKVVLGTSDIIYTIYKKTRLFKYFVIIEIFEEKNSQLFLKYVFFREVCFTLTANCLFCFQASLE